MHYPRQRRQAGEEAFPGYLRRARAILAARPDHLDDGPPGCRRTSGAPLVPAAARLPPGQPARTAGPG